ncbi:MAG: bifunctional hydroxymethylpyrimidine kinase/phosphomethylpyrimidine kinase, partial [Verrucomicrobiota bacterium]
METVEPPVALTIAGSDCSAGAGLQADLKAFSACGVYGVTAVSALVVEAPGTVQRVEPQMPGVVAEQVRLLSETFPIAAAKTGLLASAKVVKAVQRALTTTAFPVVVDPVAVASTGDSMVGPGFAEALREFITARANLVTPNRAEAEQFLDRSISSSKEATSAADELAQILGCPVLLKGGHFEGEECVDFLAEGNRVEAIT